MEARHQARKAELRDETRRAWLIGYFVGAAYAGKLKDLRHYLNDEPDNSHGGAALLGALRAMQMRGVKMKIERVERAA